MDKKQIIIASSVGIGLVIIIILIIVFTHKSKKCESNCKGKKCYEDDGCGKKCGCLPDQKCNSLGKCCKPNCDGKTCGDDGCEGNCGSCQVHDVCNDGICRQYCPDNICGGYKNCMTRKACPTWPDGSKSRCLDGVCMPDNCPQGSIKLDQIQDSIPSGTYKISTVINGKKVYLTGKLYSYAYLESIDSCPIVNNNNNKKWSYDTNYFSLVSYDSTANGNVGDFVQLQGRDNIVGKNCEGNIYGVQIGYDVASSFILTTDGRIYSVQAEMYLKVNESSCSMVDNCYRCDREGKPYDTVVTYTFDPDTATKWYFET